MKIITRSITDLVPYGRNARTHSPAQVDRIARSIKEFGWTVPILVDSENNVVAGHGRIEAARKLDLSDIPTIQLADLTPDQIRAYRIADNRLTELGTWDSAALQIDLNALNNAGFDINLTGFDLDFLSAIAIDDAAVTRGDEPEPWLVDNPVIAHATAKELPTAIIRFLTEAARDEFEEWLSTVDHSAKRMNETTKSIYMPANQDQAYGRE